MALQGKKKNWAKKIENREKNQERPSAKFSINIISDNDDNDNPFITSNYFITLNYINKSFRLH